MGLPFFLLGVVGISLLGVMAPGLLTVAVGMTLMDRRAGDG